MKSGEEMWGPGWSGQQLWHVPAEGDDGKPELVNAKATGDREINERMQGTTELRLRRLRRVHAGAPAAEKETASAGRAEVSRGRARAGPHGDGRLRPEASTAPGLAAWHSAWGGMGGVGYEVCRSRAAENKRTAAPWHCRTLGI